MKKIFVCKKCGERKRTGKNIKGCNCKLCRRYITIEEYGGLKNGKRNN